MSSPGRALYPSRSVERDRWILERRPPRNPVDPFRAVAAFLETEPTEDGRPASVAAIFLANRECPWRCLMCDLWKNTLAESVPAGAVPAQIREALARLPRARRVKLYNAGSFFDAKAIPPGDHAQIAALLARFERVIVESHPALVGEACLRWRDRLAGDLEVAIGLETIHPEVLPRLNKRMSLAQFERAAAFLRREGIALRAFVLLGLPFLSEAENLDWACRSVDFALGLGAAAVSIIPTRVGNGALDVPREEEQFHPPRLSALEAALEAGLALRGGRVFADVWNLEQFSRCPDCFEARRERLQTMNLRQIVLPRVVCGGCGGAA